MTQENLERACQITKEVCMLDMRISEINKALQGDEFEMFVLSNGVRVHINLPENRVKSALRLQLKAYTDAKKKLEEEFENL